MSGFIPAEGLTFLFDQIAAEGLFIGLAEYLPADQSTTSLLTITEVTTPGYARGAVTWAAPVTDENGIVSMTNSADVDFPVVTEDMTPAPYAFVTDVASGTTGRIYWVWNLAEPVTTLAGKPTKAPAGGLIIE